MGIYGKMIGKAKSSKTGKAAKAGKALSGAGGFTKKHSSSSGVYGSAFKATAKKVGGGTGGGGGATRRTASGGTTRRGRTRR